MIKATRGKLKGLTRTPHGESVYDSLLERDYMLELETMGGLKEWTKDHGIKIPYKIFGILPHTYHPDFLLTFEDGSKELHETKGVGFLAWASTHAKRREADRWCKERGMIYRFIENSEGALFASNNAIDDIDNAIHKNKTDSLDDLLK